MRETFYRWFHGINLSTYHLKPEKLKLLVDKLENTFSMASEELTAFAVFLKMSGE